MKSTWILSDLRRLACPARILGVALLLAPAAFATGGAVVGFDGVNLGGWSYFLPQIPPLIETSGGNPGAWLHATTDTFAPQLHNNAPAAPFTGDYRALKVVSLGVDLITNSTQFQNSRPLSLILSNGDCKIYFVSNQFVPQPGAGWKTFQFAIDSQSTTMPPGWAILDGSCTHNDAAWNAVIPNVTSIDFFYGDPTFFFFDDIWNVGADNVRVDTDPFTDLGGALAGAAGTPKLAGSGTLAPSSPVALTLTNAAPSSATALFIGLSVLNAPFKGGTLVPNPDVLVAGLLTNGTGQLVLASTWPPGIPSGLTIDFQEWIADAGGPLGFAASNGLQGQTP